MISAAIFFNGDETKTLYVCYNLENFEFIEWMKQTIDILTLGKLVVSSGLCVCFCD